MKKIIGQLMAMKNFALKGRLEEFQLTTKAPSFAFFFSIVQLILAN